MKKTPTPAQGLRMVYDLFSNKKRWTQFAFAKQSDGESCSSNSKNAVCWCMIGGVDHVFGGHGARRADAIQFLDDALRAEGFRVPNESGQGAVITWNDRKGRTIEQVRRVLKTAIKRAAAAAA